MSDCPECEPLKAEWHRLSGEVGRLEQELQTTRSDRVAAINEASRRVANAKHWLNVSMGNYAAASSYAHAAGDAAQVGGHPDLSLTPQDGWIEIDAGQGITVWARNEAARKFLGGLLSGGAAAAEQVRAEEMAEDLKGEYEANIDRLASAERILESTIEEWDAKVAAAEQAIPPARTARDDAYQAYLACLTNCGKPSKRDAVAAVFGAVMVAAGLFTLGAAAAGPSAAVAGGAVGLAAPLAVSTPFSSEVLVDVHITEPEPTQDADDPPDPVPAPDPAVASYCSGTDHYPDQPATDADGNTTSSLSKQVIGAYISGLPPGTRITIDVEGIGTTTGEVNADGYVEFQVPLQSYGTYTITSVTADVDGTMVSFDPTVIGSPFSVGGGEQECAQEILSAPPTTSTTTTTTTTSPPTVAPQPTFVPAGGGGVMFPPTLDSNGGGTIVTPGTPGTPGTGIDVATIVLGAGLLVAGSAMLGGLGAPGMGGRYQPASVTDTDVSDDELPGEPMDTSTGVVRPFSPAPDSTDVHSSGTTAASGTPDPGSATDTANGPDATSGRMPVNVPPPAVSQAVHQIVSRPALSHVEDLVDSAPDSPVLITEPRIRIDTGGYGDDSINQYQSFRIIAEFPRTATAPEETIDVVVKSSSGSEQTITLAWDGSAKGNIVYSSNVMSLQHGGQGAGKTTIAGFEFSSGGLSRFGIENGDTVTVTHGSTSTEIRAYESWVQQGLYRSLAVVEARQLHWTRVGDLLGQMEQTPEVIAYRKSLVPVMERAAKVESMLHSDEFGDTVKLAYISTYAMYMRPVDDEIVVSFDIRTFAERRREEYATRVIESGIADVALALYRTIAEASFAAAAYRLASGQDITGEKLSTQGRILAAIELAGWVTTAGGGDARSLANLLSGGGSRKFKDLGEGFVDTQFTKTGIKPTRIPDSPLPLPSTTRAAGRVVAPGARLPDPSTLRPVPLRPGAVPSVPIDTTILRARAGTLVVDPKAFGMTPEAYFHFQSVARRWGLIIRVRAANIASVSWLYKRHPPKHVKLKSKSIKPIDYHLGAKEGTEGLVGYFKPTLPANIDSFEAGLASAIRSRYRQRLLEYADNAADMGALEAKGLIRLENGVVIDTGLSSTRLVGDKLVPIPGAPPGGMQLGVTGDSDQYSAASRIRGSVTVDFRKAAAQAELSGGHANIQHGCHMDWLPGNTRDQRIRDAICGGHRGEVLPDGGVGPLRRTVDGTEQVAEGLIEFGRAEGPVVAYDIDLGGT